MDIIDIIKVNGITQIHTDLNIPIRTLENWLYGMSTPPAYVVKLINFYYTWREVVR